MKVSSQRPRETDLGYQRRIADTIAEALVKQDAQTRDVHNETGHVFVPDSTSNSLNCEKCGCSREYHWRKGYLSGSYATEKGKQ